MKSRSIIGAASLGCGGRTGVGRAHMYKPTPTANTSIKIIKL